MAKSRTIVRERPQRPAEPGRQGSVSISPLEPNQIPPELAERARKEGLRLSWQHKNQTLRQQSVAGTAIAPLKLTDQEIALYKDSVDEGRYGFAELVLCAEHEQAREARLERERRMAAGPATDDEIRAKQEAIIDEANTKIGKRGGVLRSMSSTEIESAAATPGNTVQTIEEMMQEREREG